MRRSTLLHPIPLPSSRKPYSSEDYIPTSYVVPSTSRQLQPPILSGHGSIAREIEYNGRRAFIKPNITQGLSIRPDQTAAREVLASAFGRHIAGASIPVNAIYDDGGNTPLCISYAPSQEKLIPYRTISPYIEELDSGRYDFYRQAKAFKDAKVAKEAFPQLGRNLAFNIFYGACDRHQDNLLFLPTTKKWYEIDYAQACNTRSPFIIGNPKETYGNDTLGQGYPSMVLSAIAKNPIPFLEASNTIGSLSANRIEEFVHKIPDTHLAQDDKADMVAFLTYRRDLFAEIARPFLEAHHMTNCLLTNQNLSTQRSKVSARSR